MKLQEILVFLIITFFLTSLAKAQEAEIFLHEGLAKAYEGNYKAAIKRFDKAILKNPGSAKAYYNRGHMYFKL
ncbi:MAG: tetratricopeptide repeat protein, partial [Bacteroidota bacterium]